MAGVFSFIVCCGLADHAGYSVRRKEATGYIYFLFEHKSYLDRLIHLQLLSI
ncbi:Rpn family recombination-promoting nuclease/putative transposase [Desulfobacter postgatei]|uniref:Rpn family recombination-promoting nuclease/putative transposase n=1 Tax=Desulfobacter postgatei TaxID=2293 RepID=UPI00387E05E1